MISFPSISKSSARRSRTNTFAEGFIPKDFGITIIIFESLEEKVIQIVCEQLTVDKGELSRETSFVNDLNADSLDTVELVMELEDEFDLTIPDEEAEKLKTVGEAIDYIQKNLNEKS